MKVRVVIGLVVLIAVGLVVGRLLLDQKGVILSSEDVEKKAQELLPGAAPPEGLKGVIALKPEEDLEVAIFAPHISKANPANLEGSDLRIIIAKPKMEGRPDPEAIKAKISAAQERKADEMDTLEKGPAILQVNGHPFPGIGSKVKLKDSGKELQEYLFFIPLNKQIVLVMAIGPVDTFATDKLQTFLSGLPAPLEEAMPKPRVTPPRNPLPRVGDKPPRPQLPPRPGEPPRPFR